MKSVSPTLTIMDGGFAIHRLLPETPLPKSVLQADFFALARTPDELSIVVSDQVRVNSPRSESGWACIQVNGPLEFSMVGVLAGLAGTLSAAGIPLFAISTFDTDYLLVKSDQLVPARKALSAAGYRFRKRKAPVDEAVPELGGPVEAASAILEKHLPQIRSMLVEKAGKTALTAFQNEAAISLILGSTYELLPAAVRLLVRRDAFIEFGLSNRDRLFPPKTTSKDRKARSAKKTPR